MERLTKEDRDIALAILIEARSNDYFNTLPDLDRPETFYDLIKHENIANIDPETV